MIKALISKGLKWIKFNVKNEYFIKISNTKWQELHNDRDFAAFKEIEFGYSHVTLYDATRDLFVKLTNGSAFCSSDGTNWSKLAGKSDGNFDSSFCNYIFFLSMYRK